MMVKRIFLQLTNGISKWPTEVVVVFSGGRLCKYTRRYADFLRLCGILLPHHFPNVFFLLLLLFHIHNHRHFHLFHDYVGRSRHLPGDETFLLFKCHPGLSGGRGEGRELKASSELRRSSSSLPSLTSSSVVAIAVVVIMYEIQ